MNEADKKQMAEDIDEIIRRLQAHSDESVRICKGLPTVAPSEKEQALMGMTVDRMSRIAAVLPPDLRVVIMHSLWCATLETEINTFTNMKECLFDEQKLAQVNTKYINDHGITIEEALKFTLDTFIKST